MPFFNIVFHARKVAIALPLGEENVMWFLRSLCVLPLHHGVYTYPVVGKGLLLSKPARIGAVPEISDPLRFAAVAHESITH
jgi:hypothetical protein